MTRVDPNLWQIPKWHADWDGDFQFAGLRAFAMAVLDGSDLDPRLAIIEDGYARVEVFSGGMRIGVAYVNRARESSSPEFTVYAGREDDELTTTDVAAAVRFLDERMTAFPQEG